MNKFIYGFISAIIIISMIGCSSILHSNQGIFGKSQKAENKIDTEIRHVENAQAQLNEDRLAHIGALAKGGVEHSLELIKTNVPEEIKVAKEMNERVEALAGKPDFNEVMEIENIVDKLVSQVDTVREEGQKDLSNKDKEISKLENKVKELNFEREENIAKAFAQANVNAQQADQYKSTLNQMDKFFGLGAIFYGLKKFIVSSMWVLGIGSILFLILRLLASSNPIAGAVFGIFNQIGSWLVHMIQLIFPKAVSLAGHVTSKLFDSYKSTLTKIVDAVQMAKSNASAANRTATLSDVLDEAEKSMNSDEKAIVEELKKGLNWK